MSTEQKTWDREYANLMLGSVGSALLIAYRLGALHADRGWTDAIRKAPEPRLVYRQNTTETATDEAFLKDMLEQLEESSPGLSLETIFQAAVNRAKEQITFHQQPTNG